MGLGSVYIGAVNETVVTNVASSYERTKDIHSSIKTRTNLKITKANFPDTGNSLAVIEDTD